MFYSFLIRFFVGLAFLKRDANRFFSDFKLLKLCQVMK